MCDHANETCPVFWGPVKNRLHIGFDDPALVKGEEEYVLNQFRRVRDEIRDEFYALYSGQLR